MFRSLAKFLRWTNVWWRTVPRVLEIKEVAGLSGKSTDEPFVLDESKDSTLSFCVKGYACRDILMESTSSIGAKGVGCCRGAVDFNLL